MQKLDALNVGKHVRSGVCAHAENQSLSHLRKSANVLQEIVELDTRPSRYRGVHCCPESEREGIVNAIEIATCCHYKDVDKTRALTCLHFSCLLYYSVLQIEAMWQGRE